MLRIETSQELMMVFLIGEIDHHCAGALREEIDRVACLLYTSHGLWRTMIEK